MGKGMAELHLVARQQVGKLEELPYSLADYRRHLRNALDKIQQHPQPGIDPAKLESYYEQELEIVKNNIKALGYIHGDPHLGNVLFDERKQRVTFVDPDTMHVGADPEYKGAACAASDLGVVLHDLKNQVNGGLNDAEIERLIDAFKNGYAEANGEIPSERELAFFEFVCDLKYISWFTGQTYCQDLLGLAVGRVSEKLAKPLS